MLATLFVNFLLLLVCLGFGASVWSSGQHWGPEGPVGAWLIPVPFLFLLLAILIAAILTGRFDWIPGGKAVAFLMLIGYMAAVGTAIFHAFERPESAMDHAIAAVPFVAVAGVFFVFNRFDAPMAARAVNAVILGLASVGGWGLMGYALVSHTRAEMEAAERQYAIDRVENEARMAKELADFNALPADTPLRELFQYEFTLNQPVQKRARERIAAFPNLDDEISRILTNDELGVYELQWTIGYIAQIHPAPPARLAPAYAHAMDQAYKYWETTMRYDEHAGKSEPEIRAYLEGAEKIQRAGGDLRPQLKAWAELLGSARGLGSLADYAKRLAKG